MVRWDYLDTEKMQQRVDWCRENLVAGVDWGFCAETKSCVLMNNSASLLYRLRWFEPGMQTEAGLCNV